ncbi:DedD protein [Gammaproteobacteria bacterium]
MEENKLKNRLIGATVLVALGVVLLHPWLDMRPAPGTRLENANIPERQHWRFFQSEEKEKEVVFPPTAVSTTPTLIESPPVHATPPVEDRTAEVLLTATEVAPPTRPLPKGVHLFEIHGGDSLDKTFSKAMLRPDQTSVLRKLGPSVKSLQSLQTGRNLWLRTNPKNELEELVYYSPGPKIHMHIVRRYGQLRLADSSSAIHALGDLVAKNPDSSPTNVRMAVPAAHLKPIEPLSIPPAQQAQPSPTSTVQVPVSPPKSPKKSQTQAKTVPEKTPIQTPKEQPKDQKNHPESNPTGAWIVQVRSLDQESSAKTLRDSLRKKGFPAFVESRYDGHSKRWRVRVGPSTDRTELSTLRARLERDEHTSGQVLPYP